MMIKPKIVYVIGAGLSAGLEFPTIENLLPKLWERIDKTNLSTQLAAVIRFHHPNFNPSIPSTFPNIEQLLTEMQANTQLFTSSRPVTGNFTIADLDECRRGLLLELAYWFHELKSTALRKPPNWLSELVTNMKSEGAMIISFNWDLVLDELLFGNNLERGSYITDQRQQGPCLIKPHGSLNWYEQSSGSLLKKSKKFSLGGTGTRQVFAFKPYRAPKSKQTDYPYMPLIVPPVYAKQFEGPIFKQLWQQTVAVLSTASEVRFLGYSLPTADFHARFILRCGFYNQVNGVLRPNKDRAPATGRAKVSIVNPDTEATKRISDAVGWDCAIHTMKIEKWIASGALSATT